MKNEGDIRLSIRQARKLYVLEEVTCGRGNTQYVNKTKSSLWFGRASIDFTGGANLESFLDWRVPTESDLVKLKAAMPGDYQQARGQAAFPSGQSIVTLFETADRSTLLHEMGHVFLNGLGLMAQRNEAAATEWAVVMDFLGVDDWDALTPEERTEAHETFARAFEAYLMEGKAPSTALQRAFRMFKSWLIDIYRDLMGLSRQAGRDVALSDEARDIFSRLLATDEEIAEAEALAPFLAAVEATDESRELHREATAQAAEEAGRIRSAAEMRARRKEVATQVRQELEASRGYRALFAMQRSADKGGRKINEDEFIERYGEMAWSESARPLGITSKRSTWALDDLALSLGYLTADEMVEEILALPPLKDALAAQVDLVMAQESAQENMSTEAALRNDARLAALILEHDSLAGDGPDVPRDAVDAPAWVQLLEEVEAEEQNPLSRENLLAEIRERGGIRYESIKALWGPGEAKTLRERLGPGLFRKDGRGLDQLVNELRADGVPVESTQALYDILLGEGGPQRQELDVAVDAESLPWLVWMLGRDETRDYLGKRRRAVRNALKEATEAFEADRSDEARQARVAAQRELDYIEAALTELGKDVDPDARYRVDVDPATLGQPREGRATWSQPTVREALAEQMKGTDPVKMRDAWALASRIARSAVGESRRQAWEAQKALREQVREAARARQDFQAQQRATVRARVEAARNVERALKDNNFDEAARQKDIEIINAALAYEAGRTKTWLLTNRRFPSLIGRSERLIMSLFGGPRLHVSIPDRKV